MSESTTLMSASINSVLASFLNGEYDGNVAMFCEAVLELRGIDTDEFWFTHDEEALCSKYLKEVCNVG